MNDINELIQEIDQVNDYLKDMYQDIEDTIFLGQDQEDEVHLEIKGNFEIKSIKWDEKHFKGKQVELSRKIFEAYNQASEAVKHDRQAVVYNVINEKMRF